ncbi:hypothetical protein [Aliidiomarina sp.]|uniref:hypothetical protein n=1 Tax=Aliidiomarina sp. TaxID=1872439 RepID=UPI003A4E176E
MKVRTIFLLASGFLLALSACSPASNNNDTASSDADQKSQLPDSETTVTTPEYASEREKDVAELSALLQEMRTLLGSPTAEHPNECRLVPVGEKACGGPERFLLYSTSAVRDEEKLLELANEHRLLSAKFNEKYNIMSDCQVVTRPALTVRMGMCVPIASEAY